MEAKVQFIIFNVDYSYAVNTIVNRYKINYMNYAYFLNILLPTWINSVSPPVVHRKLIGGTHLKKISIYKKNLIKWIIIHILFAFIDRYNKNRLYFILFVWIKCLDYYQHFVVPKK